MGYYLTIDQGNSSAKVVVWHNNEPIDERYYNTLSSQEVSAIIDNHSIEAAIYCSVATEGNDIMEILRLKCHTAINLSHLTPMPITIGYASPQTLGRDRIAAVVGAWQTHPQLTTLVVDLGTAVTYDVVDNNACFIGGNIAPGIKMRLDALHNMTARLPLITPEGNTPLWGYDTETSLRSGAINGVAAEIEHYRSKLPADTRVILTGGCASIVSPHLSIDHEIDPLLVNKGLNCILKHNETK